MGCDDPGCPGIASKARKPHCLQKLSERRFNMTRKGIINPNAISILCEDPRHHVSHRTIHEPAPMPEPKLEPKKSLWQKAKGFIKEVKACVLEIVVVVETITRFLNSISRFKKTFFKHPRRQKPSNGDRKAFA